MLFIQSRFNAFYTLALLAFCVSAPSAFAQDPLLPAPSTVNPPQAVLSAPGGDQSISVQPSGLQQPATNENGSTVYYDTRKIMPPPRPGAQGAAATPPPPSYVDPRQEPASKIHIVKKIQRSTSFEAQLAAADRAVSLERYEAALELYEPLYKKNKKNQRVLMGRAIAFQRLGRYEEAIQSYEALLKRAPKNIEARVNMLGLLAQKYPAVALQRLQALHKKNPRHAGVLAQLAIAEASLNNQQNALRYLGMAAALEPNKAGHFYNMAVIVDQRDDVKSAVQYYEKALEVDSIYGGGTSVPRDLIFERLARLR